MILKYTSLFIKSLFLHTILKNLSFFDFQFDKMNWLKEYILYTIICLISLSCSTKKNTVVHRFWHNTNTRFNGLFNSTESIKEGQYKIRTAHKDNFDELLPVFVIPENDEEAKKTYSEFDRAIKKASLMIKRHAIKEKNSSAETTKHGANKWIDNCWINIGISKYYKREFFGGIEALDYVTRNYAKSKDKYAAMLWLVRCYNEIGAVSESEVILDNLNNEKKISTNVKKELYAVNADYYIKRGNYKEALKNLNKAIHQKYFFNREKNIQKARYAFIAGQISEQQQDYKKAKEYYKKTIKLKPEYEMLFYAKMKMALLLDDRQPSELQKKKSELLQMTKETKNNDYLDVIYYTLGQIEEKQNNINEATQYYTLSVRTSSNNPKQKAYSYLKLGDIFFEQGQYVPSGKYYDSAVTTLPKTHKQYDKIVARKEVLQNLIKYIQGIQEMDSLIKLSKMNKEEVDKLIEKQIKQYIAEKEKKQKEQIEKAKTMPPGPAASSDPNNNPFAAQSTTFYFYNPTAVNYGIQDFIKKWGTRPLEDDWRRSIKNKSANNGDNNYDEFSNDGNANSSNKGNNNSQKSSVDPKTTKEYYLSKIPASDSAYQSMVNKIIEYYYLMALTYKEDLNNYPKSITAFEELNTKYPHNKYVLSSYYQLYLLHQKVDNISKANEYKEKILNQYPNSEYAQLIKNPNYIINKQNQLNEIEQKYKGLYDAYIAMNYQQCYQSAQEMIDAGLSDKMLQKVEFFKAVCDGRLKGLDTLEMNLKKYIALYPKSELKDRANEIILAINKYRTQKSDTINQMQKDSSNNNSINTSDFTYDANALHYFIIISPDDPKIIKIMQNRLDEFNQQYYSNEEFSITSMLYTQGKQLIILRSFGNVEKSIQYFNLFVHDEKVFQNIPKDAFEFYVISSDNFKQLVSNKDTDNYKQFFNKQYKVNGKS